MEEERGSLRDVLVEAEEIDHGGDKNDAAADAHEADEDADGEAHDDYFRVPHSVDFSGDIFH